MTQKQAKRLIQGVGVNDLTEPISKNGNILKFYDTWKHMLARCYSEKCQTRWPTYRSCSVCPEWLILSTFKEWFNANYRDGTALDKDVLVKGNKIYSPDTCRFVPQYINSLLTNAGASRGNLPLGITAHKSELKTGEITITYRAQCWDGKGKRLSETFKTIPEAVAWYSITKKEVVKEIVLDAFWRNEILSDVATALLEREW